MASIEVEIKVQIENAKPLLALLEKEGKKTGEEHQVDEYFTPAHRDFTAVRPIIEWLRLRHSDKGDSINYKHFHFDDRGKSLYCDEHESKVSDVKQVELILQGLNMVHRITVDKKRKTYLYKEYEVAFDSVAHLGDFIEIEYKGEAESTDAQAIKDGMIRFLKELGAGKISVNHIGYPHQLIAPEDLDVEEL